VTSALAANAALNAVISGESELAGVVVVEAGAWVVVGAAVVDGELSGSAEVVVAAALSPPPVSCVATSLPAHAERTRTRTANIVMNRLAIVSPTF
jgi:hypothetical protein